VVAELPGEITPRADADGADVLLATKLYVPAARPDVLSRQRLTAALDEGLARGLLLVCAPAGFGKTSLLAEWARRDRQRVGWLSLDAGDNDPARFWRHVLAALRQVRPEVAERVVPLLGPPAPSSFESLLTALVNELVATPADTVLVLDDYHLIDALAVHASLEFLVEHRPPNLALVVASRADPPLPLARLRARGELAELRAAELRFTPDEAAAVLRSAVGPELPDAAVRALLARTEGWAAGLQLAGLSLRGHTDVAGFVASFSGGHRYVLDYLAEEVLDGQPDEVRGFLLETSVLDRLSGPLCDAVTGRTGSQRLLERVERANLFLVALDEVRGWWRYHHLFADLLQARLRQERPERLPELHRGAAAWYERHGLPDDARRHALAAGDALHAARVVEQHVDELILRGEAATIGRWLATLPAELTSVRPRVCLAQTFAAVAGGDLEAAETALDAAERAFANAPDEAFEPTVGTAGSLLTNVRATIALERAVVAHLRGDAEDTARFASLALAAVGEGEAMLGSIAQWHLAVAEWLRGRLPEAERAFASSLRRWRAAGEADLVAWGSHHLGQVQLARAELDAALETYRQALDVTDAPGGRRLPASGVAYVGMAQVAYERNELDAARAHVVEGITRCRQYAYTQPLASGLATLAWIRFADGDRSGALDAIAEAERIAPGAEVTSLLNPVPAQRARLLLAHGDVDGATRWLRQRGVGVDDVVDYQREREYLVLARVLLAGDRPEDAAGLLDRLHHAATTGGRTGSEIEIQALRALALAAGGQEPAAVAALVEALNLAHPQRYIRVFADEGRPMRAVLGRLVAAQRAAEGPARDIPLSYLGRLIRAVEAEAAGMPPATAAVPGLIEALTTREVEVLRLLAAGRPNQQIARELVVAPSTVKKHVTHILEKLGAANRTEATDRARQLGLLS
jgi:LuxR family maltose regulon positive regulatory protein